jgi:hypothetical protein
MERYLWIFNRNQESYKFEFYIGEELNRFENEGIYQDIRLSINNESTFYSNFGRMESLDFFKYSTNWKYDSISNDYFNKCITFYYGIESVTLLNKDYEEFIKWTEDSLLPLEIKRKHKINNIKNRMFAIM